MKTSGGRVTLEEVEKVVLFLAFEDIHGLWEIQVVAADARQPVPIDPRTVWRRAPSFSVDGQRC
jgi:hypothetical protein